MMQLRSEDISRSTWGVLSADCGSRSFSPLRSKATPMASSMSATGSRGGTRGMMGDFLSPPQNERAEVHNYDDIGGAEKTPSVPLIPPPEEVRKRGRRDVTARAITPTVQRGERGRWIPGMSPNPGG